jgi:hypothetical protein
MQCGAVNATLTSTVCANHYVSRAAAAAVSAPAELLLLQLLMLS